MTAVRSVCPLNCPDCCTFLVEVLDGEVKVHGDRQTMGVNGFICSKGKALGDVVYSPNRLKYPLLKSKDSWQRLSWEEAYDIIAGKIRQVLAGSGSQAILHMYDYGHNGALRALDRRFFQVLGGVTEPRGSMCWGAGWHAQLLDFGAVYSSDWEELLQSKTIILWGRDPAVTNKHLIPLLRQASANGADIIVINPNRVKSTVFSNEYIRVNPATDGILALGIAHVILKNRWLDVQYVRDYTDKFPFYTELIKEYSAERAALATGVPVEVIESLAWKISHERPVMFYLGYGLQRYVNGVNTVRAIDALGAISGNIGFSGGGVFYAHQYHKDNLNTFLLQPGSYHNRTYPHATMAYELLAESAHPKIELAFVTRTNPLVTEPDSRAWLRLWQSIPFKITLDYWMSQTASQSDMVLPVTTIFEEEDILATSWSNLICYAHQAVEPQALAKPEPIIFTELARRLGLGEYFPYTPSQWLEYLVKPLEKYGITFEDIKQSPVRAPYIPKTAWEEKIFRTPSGKIELITKDEYNTGSNSQVEKYFRDGKQIQDKPAGRLSGKVLFLEEYKISKQMLGLTTPEYPYILVTPHPDMGIHSQFRAEEGFQAYIHPDTADKGGISPGDKIIVQTETGELTASVFVSDGIHPQVVVIPEGTTENNLGVNGIIAGKISSAGESTAYYDTMCKISKKHFD